MTPGVYKVIKDFRYLDIWISSGEILHVNFTGDIRVHGGLWKGFYRDKEQSRYFNAPNALKLFIGPPKNYNLKYLPEECVERISA